MAGLDGRAVRQLALAHRASSWSPARRSPSRSRGWTATTRTGWRAGPPRAGAGRCSATALDGADARADARSVPRSATASTSTAAARSRWTADGSWCRRTPTAGCTGSDPEGAADPVAHHARGPVALRGPAVRPAVRRACTRSARRTTPIGRTTTGLVVNEIVALALDGSDGRGPGPRRAGRTSSPAPRPSPDGRRLAWLEWDLPDMPWDAVAAAGGAGGSQTGRSATPARVAGGPGVSVAQPAWSPGGRPARRLGRDRLVEPVCVRRSGRAAPGAARNLRPWTAELGDPAWVFGRSSYAFAPDGSILAVARADGARPAASASMPTGTSSPIDTPFTEFDGLRDRRRHGDGRSRPARTTGRRSSAWTPTTGEPAGVLARSLPSPLDPSVLPEAEPITFPTTDGATARGLFFRSVERRLSRRPMARAAAAARPVARRPDQLGVVGAVARPRVLHVARDRRRGRGLPRLDRLRPAVPRRAQRAAGAIADVDDCVGRRPVPRRARRRRPGPHGDPRRQRRRLHDARRAHVPPGGLRGRDQPLRDRGPRADPRGRPQVRVALRRGAGRPRGRGGPHGLPRALADPLPGPGRGAAAPAPGPRRPGRAAVPARRDGGGVHAPAACRTSRSAFEGEGHGFRRAETRRAQYRAELGFLGRVFGFTPADGIEPLDVPGFA